VDWGRKVITKDSIYLQQEQKFEHHLVCELLFSMRLYAQNFCIFLGKNFNRF
jgi:hypothetical protein